MTTAAQNASAGVYVSNDVGLEVTDGTQSRVQLGLLPVGTNSYGLRVVAADGTTVIIDGTSDIFKIGATGTLATSSVSSGGGAAANNVVISALGAYTTPPMLVTMTWADSQVYRHTGPYIFPSEPSWVAGLSGGATIQRTTGLGAIVYAYEDLQSVTNFVRVGVQAINSAVSPAFAGQVRYYVLLEAGL